MQDSVFEYFSKNYKQILVCDDDKEAFLCEQTLKFLGLNTYTLPDFRANFGDDLRSFYDELVQISKVLSEFYKDKSDKNINESSPKILMFLLIPQCFMHLKTSSLDKA